MNGTLLTLRVMATVMATLIAATAMKYYEQKKDPSPAVIIMLVCFPTILFGVWWR